MRQRSRKVVNTRCGRVRGTGTNSVEFLGIPYGEPPVGERRFMAPVPRGEWEGVLDTTRHCATVQRDAPGVAPLIPEPPMSGHDVLTLNVFTPAPNRRGARLPVLVWIHGEARSAGSPASPCFHGRSFNARGVVTVTIGYRVGFDGFGYVEGSDAPVNRGLLDQILALQWVQENIDAFGGDPDRVTLAGQSEGGDSALHLLTSPRAEGLFRQVISQSATAFESTIETARALALALTDAATTPSNLRSWQSMSDENLDELIAGLVEKDVGLPGDPIRLARELIARTDGAHESWVTTLFRPVIDDDIVPLRVAEALARGAGAQIPLLMGCTRNELTMLMKHMSEYWRSFDPRSVLNEAGLPKLAAWSFVREHPELRNDTGLVLGQLVTVKDYHLPLLHRVKARLGARVAVSCDVDTGVTVKARKAPTWVYEFAWPKPGSGLAEHCSEIPFVFNCIDEDNATEILGTDEAPRALAATMHADWVRFVTTGQPGWEPWSEGHRGRIYGVDPLGTVRTAKPFRFEMGLAKALRAA